MNLRTKFLLIVLLSLLLSNLSLWLQVRQSWAQATDSVQSNGSFGVYLPVIANAKSNNGSGGTPTPVPQSPLALFLDPTWKTSNASVVVDAAGGEHVAFYYYEPAIENRPTYARYAYCPSQCDKGASWQSVALANGKLVTEVQLAVNQAGKPRLLIRTNSAVIPNGSDFYYAACDGDCSKAEQWTLTLIRSSGSTASLEFQDDALPQRSFALDPVGRPRFLYLDGRNSNLGMFYVYCDEQCEQAEAWTHVRINKVVQTPQYRDDNFYYPTLIFTSDGKPRIVTADFFPLDDSETSLAYVACDENCGQPESWQAVKLMARGAGPEASADIALDANNRPRIAFYQEGLLEGKGNQLYYLWCNDECLNGGNWSQQNLGLPTSNGQEPDLELDHAGRPRIAFADPSAGGVDLAWCNVDCESANGQWQTKVLEKHSQLYQAWPVAYPPHCDGGVWNGNTPNLVLRGNGDPQIAYDGTYHARCYYDDNPTDTIPPELKFHLIVRAARLISFANPFGVSDDGGNGTPTPTVTPTPTRTATATTSPTVTATPTPTPVAVNKELAIFANTQWKTSNASVAVDSNGRKHRAYYYDEAGKAGAPSYAVYESCSSACDQATNWQGMTFAENVNEVQLAVDAAGQPHLLIRTTATDGENRYDYYYALCTGDCTQESSWAMIGVGWSIGGNLVEQQDPMQPQRSFALDPSGRPRFVYVDNSLAADAFHAGVFYVWCDQNCGSDINEWHETQITDIDQFNGQIAKQEKAYYLSLAFTKEGLPRLVTAEYYPYIDTTDTVWRLGYFECSAMCELGYLWSTVALQERGTGPLPSADLAIDNGGHPHIAFYQQTTEGILPDGSRLPIPPRLLYLACTVGNCLHSGNWQGLDLNAGDNNGAAPAIELDAQGRPRIAYTLGATGGLGYSWCDSNCLSSTQPGWHHGVIETAADLQAALPQNLPGNCDKGSWTGVTPTLLLPANDKPHIAYDATYIAHCQANGAWTDELLMRAVRIVSFNQP